MSHKLDGADPLETGGTAFRSHSVIEISLVTWFIR